MAPSASIKVTNALSAMALAMPSPKMLAVASTSRVPAERSLAEVGVKIWMTSLLAGRPSRRRRNENGDAHGRIVAQTGRLTHATTEISLCDQALMQVEKRDYYEILGLQRGCEGAEIKKAYRKLAMECHPDHHPGDHTAEARFKELAEAYQVLSDPQKRELYDQYGHAGPRAARASRASRASRTSCRSSPTFSAGASAASAVGGSAGRPSRPATTCRSR